MRTVEKFVDRHFPEMRRLFGNMLAWWLRGYYFDTSLERFGASAANLS